MPKRDNRGREREKKFLVTNSVHTRPGQENFKKNSEKIAKKFKKLKKLFPALFLAKIGLDRPRKREKNFRPEFRSYSTFARKFRKKQLKNSRNKKTPFPALFLAKTG